jgi:hypothetical protein
MCFFPYSPTNQISVLFASESLTLLEKRHLLKEYYGSSQIRIDILIKNEGKRATEYNENKSGDSSTPQKDIESIDHFYIIYPNNLFELVEENGEIDLKNIINIYDDSHEFHEDNPNNYIYYQPGNSLKYERAGEDWKIEIVQPHPTTLEPRVLKGFIKGEIKLGAATDLFSSAREWDILTQNNISFLRVDCQKPILKDENRLIRLKIMPRGTSKSKHGLLNRWYRLLLSDDLFYSYEIFGPYNVEYRSRSLMKSFLFQTEYSINNEISEISNDLILHPDKSPEKRNETIEEIASYFDLVKQTTENIIHKIEQHVGDRKFTKIFDWRLNIQPGEYKVLRNIREYDAARVCGANKNLLKSEKGHIILTPTIGDQKGKVLYQWKTGKINVCWLLQSIPTLCEPLATSNFKCNEDDNNLKCYPFVGNFSIAFDCKKTSQPWIYLIYFTLLFGIYSALKWLFDKLIS